MREEKTSKLYVEYKEGIYPKSMKLPRKYTLTHSDETGDLFLAIAMEYDFSNINSTRDEVLGNWVIEEDKYLLYLEVLLDNDKGASGTVLRDSIFRRELPLAIGAIVKGDKDLLINNPELLDGKIMIKFKSKMPEYNVVECWGTIKEYINKSRGEFNVNFPVQYKNNQNPFIPNKPGAIPPPFNKPDNKNKERIMEEALVTILGPYIKNQVELSFGKNVPYCLRTSEVIDAKVVRRFGACNHEYEVTVGVRVGKNAPQYNNFIITFLVNDKRVTVKAVKNPRNS